MDTRKQREIADMLMEFRNDVVEDIAGFVTRLGHPEIAAAIRLGRGAAANRGGKAVGNPKNP